MKTMICIFSYLDSMFCVEVCSPQTGIQVVTQRLQSLHSGQQLTLILKNTQNKMVINNIMFTERDGLTQSIWIPPINSLHFQPPSVLKMFQLALIHQSVYLTLTQYHPLNFLCQITAIIFRSFFYSFPISLIIISIFCVEPYLNVM